MLPSPQMVLEVKNLPANAGNIRECSIPGSGRSPGDGMATHSSVLAWGNPMDRGAWWATVHGDAKSQTRLSGFISLSCPLTLHWLVQTILILKAGHEKEGGSMQCLEV